MSLSSEEGDPGAEGLVDKGYMFLDKVSMPLGEGWDPRVITPGPERIARPLFAEYEFTSRDNNWTSESKVDTFNYGIGTNLFFGTVKWRGSGTHVQAPERVGQDLLFIHVPELTYTTPTNPNQLPDLSRPLPIQVDKFGRFGYVLPPGTTHIYVKMYGTLWRKVVFDGGSTDTVQVKSWDGSEVVWGRTLELRYGDVNEDNKIIRTTGDPKRDRTYIFDRIGGVVDMMATGANTIFKYDYICDLNRDNIVNNQGGDYEEFLNTWEPTENEGDLDGAQP